jgi:hypothetical protein
MFDPRAPYDVEFTGPTPRDAAAGFPTHQFTNNLINRPREIGVRVGYSFAPSDSR